MVSICVQNIDVDLDLLELNLSLSLRCLFLAKLLYFSEPHSNKENVNTFFCRTDMYIMYIYHSIFLVI